nr:hypothetical protein [Catenulispora pinisilvae]
MAEGTAANPLRDNQATAGLDETEVRVVLADATASAADVRADEQEAQMLGTNGVPFLRAGLQVRCLVVCEIP